MDIQKLWLFLNAFLGVLTLYILNRLQNRQPFSIWSAIERDVPIPAQAVVTDLVLSSMLGAALVLAIVAPGTPPQAVTAGLGLTGLLSVHTRPT